MKKTLSTLLLLCLAVSPAFAQFTTEFRLTDDMREVSQPIIDNNYTEYGRFYARIVGETDDRGTTHVQLELENRSSTYKFWLFDHAWDKKQLKKEHIRLEKGYAGSTTKKVENIELDYPIEIGNGEKHTFRDILIEEGQTYECKIPIHLIKPKNKKRKRLHSYIDCTIRISVDTKDRVYEDLSRRCDSLINALGTALDREEFCTHKRHNPSFDEQTKSYTDAYDYLRNKVTTQLYSSNWSPDSKKYKLYKALQDSLDSMDEKLTSYKYEKHECGKEPKAQQHSCGYCKLSLEQIYNRLNTLYQKLYVGEVKKQDRKSVV